MQDDYILHYGIQGMKWGVRNAETRARYAHEGRVAKRQAKKEAKAVRKAENKKIREIKRERNVANRRRSLLSNDELDRRIRRLEKEKRLRELTASEVNTGRNEVKKLLRDITVSETKSAVKDLTGSGGKKKKKGN